MSRLIVVGRTMSCSCRQSKLVALLFAAAIGVLGCWTLKYKDISRSSNYQHEIGNHYVLTQPMLISGVNLPPGYGQTIDVYVIDPVDLSWGGLELISRETLPFGTEITVESVWRCTNCPFEHRDHAVVAVGQFQKEADVPIRISIEHLVAPYIRAD